MGWNQGTIDRAMFEGQPNGVGGQVRGADGAIDFGGLVGINFGTVSNVAFTGYLSAGDNSWGIGGVVGPNHGSVDHAVFNGSMSTGPNIAGKVVGGVAGLNSLTSGPAVPSAAATGI